MDDQKDEIRMRAKESKRAFRELYKQHKLWLMAYKHGDMANIEKLAKERDSTAAKALEAYRQADEFLAILHLPT